MEVLVDLHLNISKIVVCRCLDLSVGEGSKVGDGQSPRDIRNNLCVWVRHSQFSGGTQAAASAAACIVLLVFSATLIVNHSSRGRQETPGSRLRSLSLCFHFYFRRYSNIQANTRPRFRCTEFDVALNLTSILICLL